MHLFDSDEEWLLYGAGSLAGTGRKTSLPQSSPSQSVEELIAEANEDQKVWTLPSGGHRIPFSYQSGVLMPAEHTAHCGWRELPNGRCESVQYYFGWGWLNEKELFELRQTDPRIAP
ncbi:MAG: hypothetical protein AAB582_01015 [Patescibacteria group bacterium]